MSKLVGELEHRGLGLKLSCLEVKSKWLQGSTKTLPAITPSPTRISSTVCD